METAIDGMVVVFSYVVGCFCAGYYIARWWTGCDLRTTGSGTLGARNTGRMLGARGFILTFLIDFSKGAAAVWLARMADRDAGIVTMCMIAVVAGHIWPAQLRFRGGKGIAVGLGAALAASFGRAPVPALGLAVLAILILFAHRQNIRVWVSSVGQEASR